MINNMQFSKGSIVFAYSADLPAYLNNRPLLVISGFTHIMNKIIVCEITSQDKPGISCSLWNYRENNYLGGIEKSVILPYSIFSIKTQYIKSTYGVLDPITMNEVDNAVKFFLGYSSEIPAFMEEASYMYKRFANIPASYPFSENETINDHFNLDLKVYDKPNNDNATEENPLETEFDYKAYVKKWISEKEILDVNKIPMETAICIGTRVLRIADIMKHYKINSAKAKYLRKNITELLVFYAKQFITKNPSIELDENIPSDSLMIKVGMCLFFNLYRGEFTKTISKVSDNPVELYKKGSDNSKEIIRLFNINFNNRKVWNS